MASIATFEKNFAKFGSRPTRRGRRGVGGRGCGPGSCGVYVSARGRLSTRPHLVQYSSKQNGGVCEKQSPGCRGVDAVERSSLCRGGVKVCVEVCQGLSRLTPCGSSVEVSRSASRLSRCVELSRLSRLSILSRPMCNCSSDIVQWQQNC